MPDPVAVSVVCLHSSAASARQWRSLVAEGGEPWQWHTPDLMGHGSRPGWPEEAPSELSVEVGDVLAALPFAADTGFHLVGHSYGAAVALQLALQQPQRVLSLTLYEPVAFGVLPALGADLPELAEIDAVATTLAAALASGDADSAARGFCAYWQARDVWPELDAPQRQRLTDAMPSVRRHFDALLAAQWTDAELQELRMPVQLICGTATRASARRVQQTLAQRLPTARLAWLEGGQHLAPITEAARVNAVILESLRAANGTPSAG